MQTALARIDFTTRVRRASSRGALARIDAIEVVTVPTRDEREFRVLTSAALPRTLAAVPADDPCLPCGVHMYVGNGRVIEARHSPMFGFNK